MTDTIEDIARTMQKHRQAGLRGGEFHEAVRVEHPGANLTAYNAAAHAVGSELLPRSPLDAG